MPSRPPLDPAIAAARGLSPAQRADLDAAAKAVAMEFVWAVKRRNAAKVQKLTRDMNWEGLAALAIVLAQGISPGDFRLLTVTQDPDDGMPDRGEAA